MSTLRVFFILWAIACLILGVLTLNERILWLGLIIGTGVLVKIWLEDRPASTPRKRMTQRCPKCHGSGKHPQTLQPCARCYGRGVVPDL